MMILQMVADGKITAAEAAELLKALDGSREPAKAAPGPAKVSFKPEELEERLEKLGDEIGEKASKFAERMAEKAERMAEKAERIASVFGEEAGKEGGWLHRLIGNLPVGEWLGEQFRFEETFSGTLEPGQVTLKVVAFNGRIEVQAWDRPEYEVKVVKNVRAKDEETAREVAKGLVELVQEGRSIVVQANRSPRMNCGVAVYASVPADRTYEVELSTANGRISLDGVKGTKMVAKTANGRVTVTRVTAEDMELKTANGRIEFDGCAPKLLAHTTNGRIVAAPGHHASGAYDLHTSNGPIRINLEPHPDTGYDVEARTSNAKIQMELGELEVVSEEKERSRRYVHARTPGFDDRANKVFVRARTSNGGIRIGKDVE
jgi:DUF4097 and DUF4098 domain-containing protein YvlB